MGKIDIGEQPRGSSLEGCFPVRAPVWWGRRGEVRCETGLAGVSGRFVVLRHRKNFKSIEGFLARILRAPHHLSRPLDEMNSLLWELADGHRTFEEIVRTMDEVFGEQVAPAFERCEAALKQLGERGFILFSRCEFEDAWLTGPGIDPEGEIEDVQGVDIVPIEGDMVNWG